MTTEKPIPAVCILAGGLGSRLGAITQDVPKGLVPVAGEPFLVHQLRQLWRCGFELVVLCVGHLGEQIQDALGATFGGMRIVYSFDGPGLDGTLGAIRRAAPVLGEEFLVMYGDTYLQVDFMDFYRSWRASELFAGMTVYRNEGKFDRSNAVYRGGRVVLYDKVQSDPEMLWIDYGLGALKREALHEAPSGAQDLAHLYERLACRHSLFGYEVNHRFYEIGSPAALEETDRFLRAGSGTDDTGAIGRHDLG